ncbi:MAG: hypothetical protein IPO09_00620 [Anaeromyxobacter sp.]|nr:hypothetical protein [Anaeromyxobacter sp.]MBL0278328.1 hypothetical protein [Anaeromyxobacter sp.]
MTDPTTRQLLVEAATGAWRPRRADGGIGSLPQWHDLDDDGRREAFEAARLARHLEAALDPDGLSTTARAVLARLAEG